MKCPVCESKSKVTNSRQVNTIHRRRKECKECEYRFTTYEVELSFLSELFEDAGLTPDELTKVTNVMEKAFPLIKKS